jgi:hypothetical protein
VDGAGDHHIQQDKPSSEREIIPYVFSHCNLLIIITINKPDTVAHACDPSYSVGREIGRTVVQDQHGQKLAKSHINQQVRCGGADL